jgi:hypothetical protein
VLAYLLAVYALLRYRAPAPRRLLWPALAGAAAGLAFTTKQISVAAFPSLLLLALAYEWRRPADAGSGISRRAARLRALLAAALPLAAIVLLGQLYQWTTLSGVEAFARNIVDFTTNPQLSSSLPERMLRGGLGLTVSPFRGVFWYSPVLLLGLIGALPFTRRHRWEGIAFLLLVAAHILGYSRYLYWSGGVAWGARYMLPIIPFLLLLAAPIFAWLIKDQTSASTSALSQSTSSGLRITHYALRIINLAPHRLEQLRRPARHPLRLAGLGAALSTGAGQGVGRHRRGHRRVLPEPGPVAGGGAHIACC